jgi:hypothetical protein
VLRPAVELGIPFVDEVQDAIIDPELLAVVLARRVPPEEW